LQIFGEPASSCNLSLLDWAICGNVVASDSDWVDELNHLNLLIDLSSQHSKKEMENKTFYIQYKQGQAVKIETHITPEKKSREFPIDDVSGLIQGTCFSHFLVSFMC
jgi:hypothetical protein